MKGEAATTHAPVSAGMIPALPERHRPRQRAMRPTPMMESARILEHEHLGTNNWRLLLKSERIVRAARPGQFIMITVPRSDGQDFLLPRPMAIHRRRTEKGAIEVVYATVGAGTRALARSAVGDLLTVVGPLGTPFTLEPGHSSILLLGRGIGICSLMTVAEEARDAQRAVFMVLSARTHEALVGSSDTDELGAAAIAVTDEDGTSGPAKVEARILEHYGECQSPDVIMTCGSRRLERLAHRLGRRWRVPVQVSVEARMACGLGYCHGCALPNPTSTEIEGPLVCVDGPVFTYEWENDES